MNARSAGKKPPPIKTMAVLMNMDTQPMATNSINSNYSAMVALANLNGTADDLQTAQTRISTGKIVNSASDNPAVWSIAQRSRSDIAAISAASDSLNRTRSVVDLSTAAASQVSTLLNQIRSKVSSATDASLDSASRTQLNTDVGNLIGQINRTVNAASFNGVNLLKSGATSLSALADSNGGTVAVAAEQLNVKAGGGGAAITFSAAASFTGVTQATTLLALVNTSITNTNAAVSKLGAASVSLKGQSDFLSTLTDSLNNGISNLVDADIAKESANLQALQTKQQLGVQVLQIANSSKGALLSLFR